MVFSWRGKWKQAAARAKADPYVLLADGGPDMHEIFGQDLPAVQAPFTADSVARAIEAYHPAIEIVDERYVDWQTLGAATLVADDFYAAGCVLGAPVARSAVPDLLIKLVTTTEDHHCLSHRHRLPSPRAFNPHGARSRQARLGARDYPGATARPRARC